MAISLVTGWTEDIDYTLKADGSAVDVTGMTVAIVARDQNGNALTFTGTFSVPTPATGSVRFAPSAVDISRATAAIYYIRFKVTDGSGKISYFPNAGAEEWTIRD